MFRPFRLPGVAAVLLSLLACAQPMEPDTQPASPAADAVPAFEQMRKVDVHSHVFEDLPALHAMLRRTNVRLIDICNPGTDGHLALMHRVASGLAAAHPDVYSWASTFDLTTRDEPGWAARVTAALDETFAQGAVMTKIWKEVGLELKKPDGTYLLPDDPLFDPVYAHLASKGKPLLAHLAEPREAWLPLDPNGLHYGYYSRNPQWHLYGKPEFHSHEALMDARDRLVAKHPTLTVIGAHLGSMEHDVDEVAMRLDRYPNFNVEVSARTRNLTRQPTAKVRAFFLKYQDRLLYGVDRAWRPHRTPEETPTDEDRARFVEGLEAQYRRDWAYYAGSGTVDYSGTDVEALALPREVLEKFYHRNAERLIGVK